MSLSIPRYRIVTMPPEYVKYRNVSGPAHAKTLRGLHLLAERLVKDLQKTEGATLSGHPLIWPLRFFDPSARLWQVEPERRKDHVVESLG